MWAIFVSTMTSVFASTPGITLIVLYVKHFRTRWLWKEVQFVKPNSILPSATAHWARSALHSFHFFFSPEFPAPACLQSYQGSTHMILYKSYRYYGFMCKNIYTLTQTQRDSVEMTHNDKQETGKNISSCLSLLEIFCCFSAEWCSFAIYIMNTLFLQIIKEMLPISSQNYIFTHGNLLLINMWDCCNWTKHHKSSLFPST